MQVKIIIGTVAFMLSMVILGYATLREPARLQEFTLATEARQIETGARLYKDNCATCHGDEGRAQACFDAGGNQIPCEGIPLNYAPLLCDDRSARMEVTGWDGSKRDFIYRTIAAGRGQIMPTWSERYGGPMRDDQVLNLTAFVLNWESEELCTAPPPAAYEFPDDVADFRLDFPEDGDPERGAELYALTYGCQACHGTMDDPGTAVVGPWLGDMAEVAPTRIPGYSAEQYIYESILDPDAYIVEGYAAGLMPPDFGQRMGQTEDRPQDMVDIISFLLQER